MDAPAPAVSCAEGDVPFAVARDRILGLVPGLLGVKDVPSSECVGRVAAEHILASGQLPRFDQSAVDGYAVRCADVTPGAWLPVTGRTAAGEAPSRLPLGGALRIMTGAPLPFGADTVIAQEDALRQGGMLRAAKPQRGANVRRRGEDIDLGQVLVAAGTRLDWRHVTVLAAQGMSSVPVRRRPRIALLSSGRELRGPGESLAPGQIHDSNLPMLSALLQAGGAVVQPLPIGEDDRAAMRCALRRASLGADLVLSTAGISVGDEDHVRGALRDLGGDLAVLRVAMKPGKPLAAGRLGPAMFMGLPGNPMAALAGAVAFVLPLLARMTGTAPPATIQARAGFDLRLKPGRTEFIPVCLQQRDACLWAERTGRDGSGRLAPLLQATAFAVLSAGDAHVRRGATLAVAPFAPAAAGLARS